MAKKLIGHCDCPECGATNAEVGEDKSGNPYRFCLSCNAQYFTRGDPVKIANLTKKMRPLAASAASPKPASADPAVEKIPVFKTLLG